MFNYLNSLTPSTTITTTTSTTTTTTPTTTTPSDLMILINTFNLLLQLPTNTTLHSLLVNATDIITQSFDDNGKI